MTGSGNFLTVKDAARLVGKSPSSIRRIFYPILENDSHTDRSYIQPGVEEALQLRIKGESFAWRISEELLRREVPIDADSEKGTRDSARSRSGDGQGELLDMLRRELDIKNQQITQQSDLISQHVELISGLSERLREGNVLIGTLQQCLSLSDGRSDIPDNIVNAKSISDEPLTKSEKGNTTKAAKSAKAKPRFFSRFFR